MLSGTRTGIYFIFVTEVLLEDLLENRRSHIPTKHGFHSCAFPFKSWHSQGQNPNFFNEFKCQDVEEERKGDDFYGSIRVRVSLKY